MIRALIFDADHTLYEPNSKKAREETSIFLEKKIGVPWKVFFNEWEEVLEKKKKVSNPNERKKQKELEEVFEGLKIKSNPSLINNALKIYWLDVIENLKFSKNIREVLKQLSEDYYLVVASDEFKENLIKKLNKVFGNFHDYFNFLVTPEDTNEMKPSVTFYKLALEKLKLKPEEIMVIGDSEDRDLKPARELGMKTFLIKKIGDINQLKNFLEESIIVGDR